MPNAASVVWRHAAAEPDRIALRDVRGEWTYGDLRGRAAALARRLKDAGVGHGDRVLLIAPSVPEFVCAYCAIHAAGAVAVTANTMSTRPELEHLAADARIRLVLAWPGLEPSTAKAVRELGCPCWSLEPDLLAEGPGLDPVEVADDHDAVLLYTSGTTGRPKGARLSHGNLIACRTALAPVLDVGADSRVGTALPLFHIFGQAAVLGTALELGAGLSLLERFDPAGFLAMLRRDRVTIAAGVPTMWHALLGAGDEAGADAFADLHLVVSGGAALPGQVREAFQRRFGCTIVEGYGLTETTGTVTFGRPGRPAKAGHVGSVLPGCELRVCGDDGAEVPPGEVGEVRVRGPIVMKGYWERPAETDEVLRDGWLRTGDLGTVDADGDLRIVDRKKELIIRGGYNVYPSEVEHVLHRHPDIVEAAVVGVPDARLGEEVAAVVTLAPAATLELEALRSWAKERLSAYKVPHLLHVVEALPKGPTGKVLKRGIDIASIPPAHGPAEAPGVRGGTTAPT
ncbi:class I adenylate-forming enzyme family protein [Streptomyces avermitilis]